MRFYRPFDLYAKRRHLILFLRFAAFGFAASFLESFPIVGPYFSISNRIGAAMWAFDLEKRQHRFANGELKKLKPEELGVLGIAKPELPPLGGNESVRGGKGSEEIEMETLDGKEESRLPPPLPYRKATFPAGNGVSGPPPLPARH